MLPFVLSLLFSVCASQSCGDVRLVGGSADWEGRVEVYYDLNCETSKLKWHTVCDDWWYGSKDARVVCRQLGYSDMGAESFRSSYFGSGSGEIAIDNVNCTGNEPTLLACDHGINVNPKYCSHQTDAGARCNPFRCQDGDIRLVEGDGLSGRLEVCLDQRWGTVCNEGWLVTEAEVVCRQLGYYATDFSHTQYGEGIGPVLLSGVACTGSEKTLLECSYSDSNMCSHSQDVGVSCLKAQCQGEVRLAGGESEREGRLEVCLDGRWGTVCDDEWSPTDSQVVCKQLGYSGLGSASAHFSQGILPILMSGVECTGSESQLINCVYVNATSGCTHAIDVGVHCQPASCVDGDIQLVDGESEWKGRLEVCFSQRWGTVSGEGWDSTETVVVCRELGYQQTGGQHYTPSSGTGPVYMSNVTCSGLETKLSDCSYKVPLPANHYNDIGVSCSPVSCTDGDIQLVGGRTKREGRVKVCLDQMWGTVNGDGWSIDDSQVVCRQLQYFTPGSSIAFTIISEGTGPILMDNVGCFGQEIRLIDCSYDQDTSEDTHNGDVAVQCLPALPPAPRNISIKSHSSTSLQVQWSLLTPVTATYGTILQYTVLCSAQDMTGNQHLETAQGNNTQFNMTALEPYTSYNCCVSAMNLAGNGMAVCEQGTTLADGGSQSSGGIPGYGIAIIVIVVVVVVGIIVGIIVAVIIWKKRPPKCCKKQYEGIDRGY